ncbi:hypothetical protein F3Y22_tig00111848pilonHSYRG00209 [Hibiscus syriacus]|uniref:Uncharacterized protein n=1 Tax=Hibiscus syriacus TaxID=106335 RepID=A0A6A2X9R6_HIBSY|nr:hypothetical protein F3Y22_tig00111848pilonHSYRG00209 [Hibiscus syriacus]
MIKALNAGYCMSPCLNMNGLQRTKVGADWDHITNPKPKWHSKARALQRAFKGSPPKTRLTLWCAKSAKARPVKQVFVQQVFVQRRFSSGRALGGHMKGHLTNQLSNRSDSASSSSSSSGEEQEKGKGTESLAYGLRENPNMSFRFADPEFSFAPDSGSPVQDRESDTESRNPTRRRSKRKPKMGTVNNATTDEIKKLKLSTSLTSLIDSPPAEPEPVSSVSDTSLEEDVAMCLMLLSRDAWKRNNVERKSHKRVRSETKKPGKFAAVAVIGDNSK